MADLTPLALAADSHNIMNTGTSWADPSTWETKLGNAGKFIATAAMSGANSFYNSAVSVGNWAGLDAQERDTAKWVSSVDADWGKYYEANKEIVDVTGFVAASLIPGLAGAKLMNLGQNVLRGAMASGHITGNLARATGLLVPQRAMYLEQSAQTITQSLAAHGVMNAKTYQALAAGFHQNVLEAAAGEILIAATLHKSPTLDDMSTTDLVKNMIVGAGIGGVIGGVIDGAKGIGFLKKAMDKEDAFRLPWMRRTELADATPAADRAIILSQELEQVASPIRKTATDPQIDAIYAREFENSMRLYQNRVGKDLNDVRASLHSLSGSANGAVANMIADLSTPARTSEGLLEMGQAQRMYENLSGAQRIAKVNETTALELAQEKLLKTPGASIDEPVAIRFVSLTGKSAGDVTETMPSALGLGDLYDGVKHVESAVRKEKFSVKALFDMATLTPEQGYIKAMKRKVWAASLKEIKPGTNIHASDVHLLTRAYEDGMLDIKIVKGMGPDLEVFTPGTRQELYDHIKNAKIDVANDILLKGYKSGLDADAVAERAAKAVDIRRSYLEGTQSANEADDIFAAATAARDHLSFLQARNLSTSEALDPYLAPTVAKVVYKVNKNLINEHPYIMDAMVHYKQQQQLFVEGARRVTAKHIGADFLNLPEYQERELLKLNRRGAGATLLAGANSGYGTPGQVSTQVGKVTQGLKQRFVKEATDDLTPSLQALGAKPEAAIEFSALSQKVARSTSLFEPTDLGNGVRGLMDRKVREAMEKAAAGGEEFDPTELLKEGTTWHSIKNDETWNAVNAHTARTSKRVQMDNEINAARGHTNEKFTNVFRPIRPNPNDYPFFAFVQDPRITNSNHTAMIHAASEKELAALIDKVPEHFKVSASPEVAGRITVRTKLDVESYYKARGDYEFQRTLHENYINSELASKGVYSDYFPKSDPKKIIDDILQQHVRQERVAAQELVRLHYQPVFDMMEDMGDEYSRYATSRFASRTEAIQKTTDNPYYNQVKTALDISNLSENHLIHGMNRGLDKAASRAWGAMLTAWDEVGTKKDLGKINQLLQQQGMQPVPYDAALDALANHSAPRGVLTEFVRKANSMLSLFTLGLDPLNAINNAIGSNVLRMTELHSITRAIKQGNEELAGDLAALAKIKVPGTGDSILAPSKLVANAIDALMKDGAEGPLKARYKSMGLIKDRIDQLHLLVDDFTLRGTESVEELAKREDSAFARVKDYLAKGAEKGEIFSGNKFAEEANRFISANVMDQITSLGIKHGLMDEKTAQAYINTFVNRVEGSIIASQRPLVFQGPIGQAVGLFQRYQFNLLQQMFRYVAEGSRKDVAMLMGMQGSLYGLQGLPAFQFINTHILGQLSGNTEHKDAYTYTYGALGKEAADWVMYGAPSNILHTNLFSRGDINPRHITILPTTLQEIPLVQGWGKFFMNMKETAGKLGQGGATWETILQGVEHNGISRPLAGFAQVFQGFGEGGKVYGTSNQGSILYSNDLVSWASIVRMAGGRPLDEAKANDNLFRMQVYKAADREKIKGLKETVKTTLISGNEPTADQVEGFASAYAKYGGKQEQFNRFMLDAYKDANVSQSEQLRMNLNSPFSKHMQLLMGGSEDQE